MVAVPSFVSSNAKRGLKLLEYAGDGLKAQTVREARSMASGTITAEKVRRMAAWLARHESDLSSPDADAYLNGTKDRPTAGQVAWLLWGADISSAQRDRARRWAERKRDQLIAEGELSKQIEKQVSATVSDALKRKVDEHNKKFGDTPSKRVTLSMLEQVFERGVGAYNTNPSSVRPNVGSSDQWAYARVNAFLSAVRTGRYKSGAFDTDILPEGHPLSTRKNTANNMNADVTKELPPSYRQTTEANVPTFKPSCGTCEYACVEMDTAGRVTMSCHRWEAEVQATGYCDAWELNDENLPGWLADDEEDDAESVDETLYPMMKAPAGALTEQLRVLLADVFAFYFQAHAAHWNVRGQDFSQYHNLFADIYSDAYESVDPIAENIRKLGADTPRSVNELVAMRTTTEPESTFTPQDLASSLLMVNEQVLASLRSVFSTADTANEQGIANFIAERIDQHQKWSWQLRSSLTGNTSQETAPLTRSVREEPNGQWTVYSQSGRLFGTYDSQEQALSRLAQIEQFSANRTATAAVDKLISWHDGLHSLANATTAHKVVHDIIEDELEGRGIARPYSITSDEKIALLVDKSAGIVAKANEQRYTLGPWYVPGVEDAHGEFTDEDTLQKALWDWVRSGDRTIYLQHSDKPAGEMVEIMTVPFAVEADLTVPNQGVTKYQFPANTPFMGVVWEDWSWQLVKEGKLRGYSIGGTARRMSADLPADALI